MYLNGLDELDQKIVQLLIKNARFSYSDIGKEVGISRVAVKARIQALEKKGVIEEYTTIINPQKISGAISCYFEIETLSNSFTDVIEILNIWKSERKLELGLKEMVCKNLIKLIFAEAVLIALMVVLQGTKIWNLEEWTFRLIIVSVFAEIVGVFIIVVKSLFPEDSSKSMLELIKHIYGNDRRDS